MLSRSRPRTRQSSKYFAFDIDSLKNAVRYLQRNCYFANGDKFSNIKLVYLWDQAQRNFSLILFYSIMNSNM